LSRAGSKRRLIALLAVLAAVSALGLFLRGDQIREWWLGRRSTEELRAAAERPEADAQACFLYAQRLVWGGRTEEALSALDRAEARLGAHRESALAQRIYAYMGYLYARQGDLRKAVPYLKHAQALNEDDALPHLGFGILFSDQKMPKFAQPQFDLATQLDPNNVEGWYRLGRAAMENLKAQQAIEPLKRAVALAPKDAASHAELGTAYAVQSQFTRAVPEFRRATELAPDNGSYRAALANAMAMSARSESEYREAAAQLEHVLQSRPTDEVLEFTLGLLHQRFNNLEEARRRFKRCVTDKPADAEAWYNLSLVEQRLGDNAASATAQRRFQQLSQARTETVNLEKKAAAMPSDARKRVALASAYERAGNIVGMYWQLNVARQLQPNAPAISAAFERARQLMKVRSRQSMTASPTSVSGETPGPPPPPELLPRSIGGTAQPTTNRP
jgi:tetratricopeptide (TPR) repeat protein